ncbi:alpha-1,3-mannosyl-glycoprotein 4-beta-N-acetylglucosaminyltransferase C-like isoform X3 [Portunus trituberculatus]|uniref:alpha-1,3-mannosyl-glycoprotein 4-beta-N-acetylglucosaminyltransferase C-like isoform X3 n=1 Tax=Portunus trituberculatus TaxID=210409 RepID=UPI001E1CC520|nr:alpha-1,3-mannosyl-glycoprotein 4-beta-N-acetylglucosaminyltransferase C-like isoform X3 [Portunus trituberculatus]XP_045124767.1 alpha-1,3-mannosyl-glycoprotein 4-beta-N-acetylglucosaminyltransferase C-like isoform X3 [Portunus trituberculatus]
MSGTAPAPLVLVLVSALLLSCNVFWLYSTTGHTQRAASVCVPEVEAWGTAASSGVNSSGAPYRRDYQRVVGSGQRDVPFPIPVPNDTVLLGTDPEAEDGPLRYLTIGISSVWRKDDYLTRTIDSILKETTQEEKADIFIFLLLADADASLRSQRAIDLGVRYSKEIQRGLLRVLQPPSALYPSIDFTAIRRTYNDSVARVQWRTKQLAGFLGIGQLLRCGDLERLVSFLLLFYREHPVDVLINHWVSLMAPEKPPKDRPTRRVPGLFQHIGVHSTLANKTQSLKDNTFSLVKRRFSHVNPTADVVTTIRQYKAYLAEHAYSSAPGMFWGIPRPGDSFDVLFAEPLKVSRVVVLTGAVINKKVRDRLLNGSLEASPTFVKMETPKKALCKSFTHIQNFKNGEVDAEHLRTTFPQGIQCIRVAIGPRQRSWVAITEVAVFTEDDQAVVYSPVTVTRVSSNSITSAHTTSNSKASQQPQLTNAIRKH